MDILGRISGIVLPIHNILDCFHDSKNPENPDENNTDFPQDPGSPRLFAGFLIHKPTKKLGIASNDLVN